MAKMMDLQVKNVSRIVKFIHSAGSVHLPILTTLKIVCQRHPILQNVEREKRGKKHAAASIRALQGALLYIHSSTYVTCAQCCYYAVNSASSFSWALALFSDGTLTLPKIDNDNNNMCFCFA